MTVNFKTINKEKMKKVSHEVPLVLLEKSREFNDYDYALVHLFETLPEYYNFYKKSVEMGRDVLLDNSIFELGKAFDQERFAYWVKALKPTRYIIPDVLDSMVGTVENLYKWNSNYKDLPGRKIGVLQGDNLEDLITCYKEINFYCDEIAISFNYKYYGDTVMDWYLGRPKLIRYLYDNHILNRNKPHHLLGASLPQEFKFYRDSKYDFINSLDTSSPIVHGLLKIRYKPGFGLHSKKSIKLVDLIDSTVDDEQMRIINYNLKEFRSYVGTR